MMYQKADKRLLAEDIPKNTITNKNKLLKGNYSYWNALYDLCAIAYELHTNHGEADIAKAFNSKSEFEYSRGAGMMTRKDPKLIEQYKDTYRGREIDVESHIKKGTKESSDQFIRIYFGFDGESQKIIISSVGQHLNTYSTKFMR